MQSARVPTALAPTDGNTGGGVPDEAPGAGPLEVFPLDDACRYKSLKSNRRAVPEAPYLLIRARRGSSNGLLSRPAAAPWGKVVVVVAPGRDGLGRARKKASVVSETQTLSSRTSGSLSGLI
jgi:hypothetical protein